MKRQPDWEKLLHAAFEGARAKRFEWGVFDCALFACDCLHAISGVDPAERFRGTYSDESGARQLIGESFLRFANDIAIENGMKPVHRGYCTRGDVVLVNNGTPYGALGIVAFQGHFAWCAAEKGLARVPMDRWMVGWRISA